MKILELLKKVKPIDRYGGRTEFDLIENSHPMTKEEISGLFESLNPWFLTPGYKVDPQMEDGHRVFYIPLCDDDVGGDGFGCICYVRKDSTAKSYQLVAFEEARKRIDAHAARKLQEWIDDCQNGHDGEA